MTAPDLSDDEKAAPASPVPFQAMVYGVALALMIGWFLHIAADILVPMVLALMTAYVVLSIARMAGSIPVVGKLLPPSLRYVVAAVVIGFGLVQLATLLAANLAVFVARAPEFQAKFLEMAQTAAATAGFQGDLNWETLRRDVLGQINLQATLRTGLASSASLLGGLVFVLLNVVFMLLEQASFDAKIGRMSSDQLRVARVRSVVSDINAKVGRYLAVKTMINITLGVISYVIMLFAGLEFAALWAIIIALINYIPYIGTVIGVFLPSVVAIVQFGQIEQVLVLVAALSVAQFMIGNVLEPQVMGNSLDLSPYAILISLTVWTSLWGVAGAIVAVPITAVLVIILSEFPSTRALAILLSRTGDIQADKIPRAGQDGSPPGDV